MICTKYAKRGHFAKICRSDNVNFLQNNNEEESRNDNENHTHETDDNDPVAFDEFSRQNGCKELQKDNFSMLAIEDTFEIKQTVIISDECINGRIVKLKTKTTNILAIADSGISMSFVNKATARRLQ